MPDMEGTQCAEYHPRKKHARWINQIGRVFNSGDEDVDNPFSNLPKNLDADDMLHFAAVCKEEGPNNLFMLTA